MRNSLLYRFSTVSYGAGDTAQADAQASTQAGFKTSGKFCGLLLWLSVMFTLAACTREAPVLSGATMGTTYTVIVPRINRSHQNTLQSGIDAQLAEINNAMSTYQHDSYITRFNASESTGWFTIPQSFLTVVNAALTIAQASDGAFDPTIGPVVERWGFAKQRDNDSSGRVPSPDELTLLLQQTGYSKLAVDTENSALKKADARLQLDLNAIAKGYAVDQLAAEVESLGYTNYLVEIGGELRLHGKNLSGEPWRIGIEKPGSDGSGKSAQSGLNLNTGGVATSGDYRNAFEQDGTRYSHIIDARNGVPVRHGLASVTVVAESAMLADGWATALMVLGPVDGLKIAEKLGLASYFIVRDQEQSFRFISSSAFEKLEKN